MSDSGTEARLIDPIAATQRQVTQAPQRTRPLAGCRYSLTCVRDHHPVRERVREHGRGRPRWSGCSSSP